VKPLPVVASQRGAYPDPVIDMGGPGLSLLEEEARVMGPSSPLTPASMRDLETYDNYDRYDPLRPTARDVAFSNAMRARLHSEPILPDLPTPPVVLG